MKSKKVHSLVQDRMSAGSVIIKYGKIFYSNKK